MLPSPVLPLSPPDAISPTVTAPTLQHRLDSGLTGRYTIARGQLVVPSKNMEAYNLYLKGRFFFNKFTEQGLRKALDLFQHALLQDPGYARACAGIARTSSPRSLSPSRSGTSTSLRHHAPYQWQAPRSPKAVVRTCAAERTAGGGGEGGRRRRQCVESVDGIPVRLGRIAARRC